MCKGISTFLPANLRSTIHAIPVFLIQYHQISIIHFNYTQYPEKMIPNIHNHEEGTDSNDEWGHHAEVPEQNDNDSNSKINNNNPSASDLRQMANAHFANSDFDSALPLYTAALEAFESEKELENTEKRGTVAGGRTADASTHAAVGSEEEIGVEDLDFINTKVIYLCNRAACLYRMEMYEESRVDALEAVNISNGKCF